VGKIETKWEVDGLRDVVSSQTGIPVFLVSRMKTNPL
jgi:hypothetical protein